MNNNIKNRLREILEWSKINHKIEIMTQPTLKDAHIYCKIHNLSGQMTGPLLEHYIKHKYGMTKNNASACSGDLYSVTNQCNLEIKISNGGKEHNRFNYVQLRMNHDCDYLLTAYYLDHHNLEDLGELFIFRLNKDQIKTLILKYGGYAHGTLQHLGEIKKENLDDVSNEHEYAIRPKYGDKCWNELLSYRVNDII